MSYSHYHKLTSLATGLLFLTFGIFLFWHEEQKAMVYQDSCTTTSSKDGNDDICTIASLYDSVSHAGLLGHSPKLPQTMPVRRIASNTSEYSSLWHSNGWHRHPLLLIAPASIWRGLDVHSRILLRYAFINTIHAPATKKRACEYYVYALREIII